VTVYALSEDDRRLLQSLKDLLKSKPWEQHQRDTRYATPGRVLLLGKTNGAIAKNDSPSAGNVSVWVGTPGSETDSGDDITAFNKFADIGSGKWVVCELINGGWYICAADCS
jgi:hypothetical protein